jgi:hypothetical protein
MLPSTVVPLWEKLTDTFEIPFVKSPVSRAVDHLRATLRALARDAVMSESRLLRLDELSRLPLTKRIILYQTKYRLDFFPVPVTPANRLNLGEEKPALILASVSVAQTEDQAPGAPQVPDGPEPYGDIGNLPPATLAFASPPRKQTQDESHPSSPVPDSQETDVGVGASPVAGSVFGSHRVAETPYQPPRAPAQVSKSQKAGVVVTASSDDPLGQVRVPGEPTYRESPVPGRVSRSQTQEVLLPARFPVGEEPGSAQIESHGGRPSRARIRGVVQTAPTIMIGGWPVDNAGSKSGPTHRYPGNVLIPRRACSRICWL